MEKKDSLKRLLEKIVYVFLIVLMIFSSVYGPIYIRFIPLLFLLGIIGRVVFKRQVITTVFGATVALCINLLKTPNDIIYVFFISFMMAFYIALGELLGNFILKLYENFHTEKSRKVTFGYSVAILLNIIVALGLHNITNGDIFRYQKAQEDLKEYLLSTYQEEGKFKEVSANFYLYPNAKFVFYEKEVNSNRVYKFSVYEGNESIIIDEYKVMYQQEKIQNMNMELNKCIIESEDSSKYDHLDIKVVMIDDQNLGLEIGKNVTELNEENLETFAKEVVEYLEQISNCEAYKAIDEIRLCLKNKNQKEEKVSSILYMEEYQTMLEDKTLLPYKYILKSLNIEYSDEI